MDSPEPPALYLHGPGYQDTDEGAKYAFVNGGFFVYMITRRSKLASGRSHSTPTPVSDLLADSVGPRQSAVQIVACHG